MSESPKVYGTSFSIGAQSYGLAMRDTVQAAIDVLHNRLEAMEEQVSALGVLLVEGVKKDDPASTALPRCPKCNSRAIVWYRTPAGGTVGCDRIECFLAASDPNVEAAKASWKALCRGWKESK